VVKLPKAGFAGPLLTFGFAEATVAKCLHSTAWIPISNIVFSFKLHLLYAGTDLGSARP